MRVGLERQVRWALIVSLALWEEWLGGRAFGCRGGGAEGGRVY